MKRTAYFTPNSIDRVASAMLEEVAESRARHPMTVDRNHIGLLILDLQHYFSDPSSHAFIPSLPAIVPRLESVARAFMERERPVILTRHIDERGSSKAMKTWWRDTIDIDEEKSQLIDAMYDLDATTLAKHAYDAFHGTDLEEHLRTNGVHQLVVGGVHTHLCCETTARSAFVRGFDVFFTVDGTATYNEAFHRASLLNLAHGFAVPILCQEILSALERR